MTNEITTRSQGLAEIPGFTPDQVQLIKNTVAVGATNDELKLFLAVSKRAGLDPFTKQIHFVKRKRWNSQERRYDEVGSIQTGIDGYRAIAERTGQLAGIDDATFDTEKDVHPNKASVTVYRMINGQRQPFTASARWLEYVQAFTKDGKSEVSGLWKKMPYLMLAKCAEALALRKAFPNDLSGIYTNEEMQQADNQVERTPVAPVQVEAPKKATAKVAAEKKTAMSDYDKARAGLEKVKTVEEAEAIKEKLLKSDKYNDEQKQALGALIDEKIADLNAKNEEADAATA